MEQVKEEVRRHEACAGPRGTHRRHSLRHARTRPEPRLHPHRRCRARHRDRRRNCSLHRGQSSASGRPALRRCWPAGAHSQRYSPTSLGTISAVDILAIRDQQQSFEAFGAIRFGTASVPGPGGPEVVTAGRVTSGFFKALGVARGLRPSARARRRRTRRRAHGRGFAYRYAERALGGAATRSARRSPSTA